ncbi:hypothetical protein Hanom_Chr03g00211431 [Helianthus anomalus]
MLTEISTDVNSSHLVLDVQGKILAEIKKNQGMWERLLEEPPSSWRNSMFCYISFLMMCFFKRC